MDRIPRPDRSQLDVREASKAARQPQILRRHLAKASALLAELGPRPGSGDSKVEKSVSHSKRCINPGEVTTQNPTGGAVAPPDSSAHITVDSGTLKTCTIS